MAPESPIRHEELQVYQLSLSLYCRAEELVLNSPVKCAAVDHLDRALESILENIANGNSSWSIDHGRQYFGVACGSALESAGCLDILCIRGAIQRHDLRASPARSAASTGWLPGFLFSSKSKSKSISILFRFGPFTTGSSPCGLAKTISTSSRSRFRFASFFCPGFRSAVVGVHRLS